MKMVCPECGGVTEMFGKDWGAIEANLISNEWVCWSCRRTFHGDHWYEQHQPHSYRNINANPVNK